MPTIRSIAIAPLQLPFRTVFTHSLSSRDHMESLLVRVEGVEGSMGWGEGCPRDYVTGESLAACLQEGPGLVAGLKGLSYENVEELEGLLAESPSAQWPSLRCALEMALLDLLAHAKNCTVGDLFGPAQRERVRYSGVLTGGKPESTIKQAQMAQKFGFAEIKLKVGPSLQDNLATVEAVKNILGPKVEYRVDANACWSPEEAKKQITALCEAGIRLFEQPLPVEARDAYPALRAAIPREAEIMVDESLTSAEDADWFRKNRGADRFLLKISKNGGLLPTWKIAREALAHGIPVQLGCHVGESSFLSAAGRLLVARIPFSTVEGSFGKLLLEEDVTAEPLHFGKGGWAPVDTETGPGWGFRTSPHLFKESVPEAPAT